MPVSDVSEIRRWSTDDVPASKRLDYFAAAVSEAVVPMCVDQAEPGDFSAELRFARLAEINVTNARGDAHTSLRGRAELARSSGHSFNLLMSLKTGWTAEHRGDICLAPRDVLVFDSEYPIRINVRTSFQAVNVAVPEEWLRRWVPDPRIIAARRIPGDSVWGLALSMTIEEIAYRAGFLSASHFSQVIRGRTGRTPRQVRRGDA